MGAGVGRRDRYKKEMDFSGLTLWRWAPGYSYTHHLLERRAAERREALVPMRTGGLGGGAWVRQWGAGIGTMRKSISCYPACLDRALAIALHP